MNYFLASKIIFKDVQYFTAIVKEESEEIILFFKIIVWYFAVKIHQKLSFVDTISCITFFDSYFKKGK